MWPFRRTGSVPAVDPALGDPGAAQLRADLTKRDWRAAHEFLRTVDHPDDVVFYLNVASEVPGVQAWITEWIDGEPKSTLPLLVRGAHAIEWAWQARGTAFAKDTSQAQFQMFARRLKLAEDCLNEAVERDRDDPTGWALLITTAMGRGLGVNEARRRFAEAIARHRWHVGAHLRLLTQLKAKWGGSHDEMHQFADGTVAGAPPGSPLGMLVVEAHLERWLGLPAGEDVAHLRQPEVRAALHQAADRSVRHPAYQRRPGWPAAYNRFAMAFWVAGEYDAAAGQFDAIGDLITEWPWDCLNDGPRAFVKARSECYAKRAKVGS